MPAPPGSRPLRAFYTPTKKSACVLFQRNTGSTFIECGINKRTTGYKLSSIGRARLADWQDPRERFPGIAFKTARYGRTQFASNGAWRPMGNADRNIMCLVSVKTGIECTSPDGHGLRISLQYRRAY